MLTGTLILFIGFYLYRFKSKSRLIGKTVQAKYIGVSSPNLPLGSADMVSPLKNGEILRGTISAEGLNIIRSGGFAGSTPMLVTNGKFEIINVIS